MDYYIMYPIDDESLKVSIPINNNDIRTLITKDKIQQLIKDIPNIEVISCNDKMIENEYKKLLYSDNYDDLIKIIKTTYTRNQNRKNNQKKISEKDLYYFEKAERYLYNEFSIVLNKTYDETKQYIINEVNRII